MTGDLRADRRALLTAAVLDVEEHADVPVQVMPELGDGGADVEELRAGISGSGADVLLLLVTMAAPPAAIVRLVTALPEVSVLVWACAPAGGLADSLTHADIVMRGATVGTPMVTSDLVAVGRPFTLLDAAPTTADASVQLSLSLPAAAVAARVRRARVGRLGSALPGYTSVDDTDDRLHDGLGLQVVSLPASVLPEACEHVGDGDLNDWYDEHERAYDFLKRDHRAVVAAVALQRTMERHGLDSGTLNCHIDELRGSRAIGAPCLALGHATSGGRPWTCTGDVLTAISMLIASLLTGTSLYHEIEAYDDIRDDYVLANSGEHDNRWSPSRPQVDINPWWPNGVSARHDLSPGPCTELTLRRTSEGHRLVVAEGAVSQAHLPGTGTASGRFSFASPQGERGQSGERPGRVAWRRWVLAGAGHHSCLARGHVAEQLAQVARHLRIECTVVTDSCRAT